MQEMIESGSSLTDKCSDTTDESILSTLSVTQKQNSRKDKKIPSNQQKSGTNVSSAKRDPLPHFLCTDLSRLSFQIDGNSFQADDTDHTAQWVRFVAEHADLPPGLDWEDLEERVHFLNMLYTHCEANEIAFPLNFSSPDPAS